MPKKKCKKVSFPNEEAAGFYMVKLNKTAKYKKKLGNVYLCPDCLTWHMTSQKDDQVHNLEVKLTKKNEHIKKLQSENRILKELIKDGNGLQALVDKIYNLRLENEALKKRVDNHEKPVKIRKKNGSTLNKKKRKVS